MTMVAEYGKLSLKDDLAPAIEMADGYAIERQLTDTIERYKNRINQWPISKALFVKQEPARSSASPISPRLCASWLKRSRTR